MALTTQKYYLEKWLWSLGQLLVLVRKLQETWQIGIVVSILEFPALIFKIKKILCTKEALCLVLFGFFFPWASLFNLKIESILIKSFIGFIIFQGLRLFKAG